MPAAGEYELRNSLAMLIMDRLGAGGSFTELQALNFTDGVVEMGHDGEVVPGPLPRIGNTTSRVDFGADPGEWTDAWSASGVNHHWALGTGHRAAELAAVAELLGLEFREVRLSR